MSVTKAKGIYVIIVTYNGMRWINKCLLSLRTSVYPLKTIVIDNASSDETVHTIRKDYPEVELIESNENLGFAKANNIGMKRALTNKADYVFLLNQDTWIEPDTLEKLITVSETNLHYGIISPMHHTAGGRELDRQFARYIGPTNCNFFYNLYTGMVADHYESGFVNAAAWLIRRDCLLKVGLFDPLFHSYGEDINYAKRVRMHHFRIGIVPAAKIVHDRAERNGKMSDEGLRNQVRIFMLSKLLDISGSVPANILKALKIFSRFGVNFQTVGIYIYFVARFTMIARRLSSYRKSGFLIE